MSFLTKKFKNTSGYFDVSSTYDVGSYTLTLNYDNGADCEGTETKQVTVNANQLSSVKFAVSCSPRTFVALIGKNFELPGNIDTTLRFSPVSQTSGTGEPVDVNINSNDYHLGLYGKSVETLANDITYQVADMKPLLSACDCVVKTDKDYVQGEQHANTFEADVTLSPQLLITQGVLGAGFKMSDFLHAMQQGGYNASELSGVRFTVDTTGAGELSYQDGENWSLVSTLLPKGLIFPAYARAYLTIANAQDITQGEALASAMQSVANVGLVLNVNALGEGDHAENVNDLVAMLLKNGINDLVIDVSNNATPADLQALTGLSSILNANGKWRGWIQARQPQLSLVLQAFMPHQVVLNLSSTDQPVSEQSVLEAYHAHASEINGVLLSPAYYDTQEVNSLRNAIFMGE